MEGRSPSSGAGAEDPGPRPGRFVRADGAGAESALRRDLDGIVVAALAAVEPERLVRETLEAGSPGLPPPPKAGAPSDLILLAVGKAAPTSWTFR